MAASASVVPVLIEVGKKRVFASTAEFPGWSRSGRDQESALTALTEYRDRYAHVAERAGVRIPARPTFEVIDVLPGDATTDFGAPSIIFTTDRDTRTPGQRAQLAALVQACWSEFAEVAVAAPEGLRKGPRGGGRDTSGVAQHVTDVEKAYRGKMGIRGVSDPAEIRKLMVEVITSDRQPVKPTEWPAHYAARRLGWHALDHAWEIEDRSE